MQALYFYIFSLFLLSCKGVVSHEQKSTLRDSVFNLYKELSLNNGKIDTSEVSYRLLKAYALDDSATLHRINVELKNEKENRTWPKQLGDCIKLTNLTDMDIEEGYRFEYDGAMCSLRQITTIYKRKDTIKLKFELYQLRWDTAECRKLEEIDRVLTAQNWKDFLQEIEGGDFWGLKSDNHRVGLDGSTYYITGFRKATDRRPQQFHFVHRWEHTSLYNAFEYATLLAANKNGCLSIKLKN
jgi:hypothetical protein